jgi:hypothetical protein
MEPVHTLDYIILSSFSPYATLGLCKPKTSSPQSPQWQQLLNGRYHNMRFPEVRLLSQRSSYRDSPSSGQSS